MHIWHAEYDTRHFHFDAFGRTSTEAVGALISGLKSHARQCNLASDEWYNAGDINVREVTVGMAYRDKEPCVS